MSSTFVPLAARPRTVASWALLHGLPRVALKAAARRGDLVAATAIDSDLRGDPFPTYDRIRTQGELVDARLLSATVHHRIANEVLRSDAFGVGPDKDLLPPWMGRALRRLIDPENAGPIDPPSLLAVNPPEHTHYRRLVSKVFTPRAIEALRPRIREVADDLLDQVSPGRRFDLVERYAKLLPLRMIAEILGVPEDMYDLVLRTAHGGALHLDPGLKFRQYVTAEAAVHEGHAALAEHIDELRANPGPDLLSQLARLDGPDRLSDLELRTTALLLIGAGFETTVNLIANGVVQLLAHPDQLAGLRADPAGWPNAVEEVLRYDSPVQVTVRRALRDTELAGQHIPRNRFILTILAAANRDPEVFDDPHRFDVTRPNAREHLAFSAGVHFCLGANLARMEGAIALEALFDRFPDLAIAGTPERRGNRVLRGYESLPVISRVGATA